MKSAFRIVLFSIIVTFVVLVVAILAAPHIVTQEKIKSFVENNLELPDNMQLKLPKNVSFSLFPYAYVDIEELVIIQQVPVEGKISQPTKKILNNIRFGFNLLDLLGDSLEFSAETVYDSIEYKLALYIKDYDSFRKTGSSPIVLDVIKPVNLRLGAVAAIGEHKYSLKEIFAVHEDVEIKGNIAVSAVEGKIPDLYAYSGDLLLAVPDVERLRQAADYRAYIANDAKLKGARLVSGKAAIDIDFDTIGSKPDQLQYNFSAVGSVKASQLKFEQLDMVEFLAEKTGIKLNVKEKIHLEFDDIAGEFAVRQGKVSTPNVELGGEKFSGSVSGDVDVNKKQLNLKSEIKVNVSKFSGKVPFEITGSFDNPKIRPIINESLVGNVLENFLQKKLNKLDNSQNGASDKKQAKEKLIQDGLNIFKNVFQK